MNRIQIVLIVFISFLLQQFVTAQTNQNVEFLQTVGVLDSLYSKVLKEQREIYVQLPASYNPSNNQEYSVIYVLDGEVLLPTVSNVQSFYSGGFMPEMIIVGISNRENRTRDLTTSKVSERYGRPFDQENGEATNFSNFIETELIPFVESKYHVTNFRTLIGHSYGGLFTIYSLVHRPKLFSNYIAIDPSLDWDSQKLLTEAKEKLANNNYKGRSLFMSLGGQLHMQDSKVTIDNVMQDESDFTLFARSNITFSEFVKQNEKNELIFNWKFYPNDIHGTIPFPSIKDGLISSFEWYQMENTDKINSFDTPKEELFNIIKYRENKLKNHFGYPYPPYPEELLNMLGYMNMEMNQSKKAKMCFELAIKYYPQSANSYNSIADYYEAQDDIANALKFVHKASELSNDNFYKERIIVLMKK